MEHWYTQWHEWIAENVKEAQTQNKKYLYEILEEKILIYSAMKQTCGF